MIALVLTNVVARFDTVQSSLINTEMGHHPHDAVQWFVEKPEEAKIFAGSWI